MAHIQKLGMMNMVREEREKLTLIAKELTALLDGIEENDSRENAKYTEVRKKTLDLLKLLANVAGFCDKDAQDRIRKITELVIVSINEPIDLHSVRKVCGLAVALQVSFDKYPFTITELDINVLGNEFKSAFKK